MREIIKNKIDLLYDCILCCFFLINFYWSIVPWVGKIPWRKKWQSTPVFLPGESHGQGSLVCYSPWGHKGSDTTN